MKKSIFVNAAIIALAMLASCQKEQLTENVTPVTGVTEFTATIEQPTKTVISDEGKVTWVAGDTITVTDAASASAVYVAGSDGARTTFTLREGETAVGTGPYTATYGDIDNQEYDAAGANCPLTAAQTSTTNFKFSSPYAVVKITAKSDGGEVIDSVGVSYGEKTYTLDCGEGVALTSEGIDFFVSVEPATDVALSATFHTDDKTATKTRTEVVTLVANDLLPVTLTFAEDDWESSEEDTPGALKGVFTVSDNGTTDDPSDDIKVHFSKGNLWYGKVGGAAEATFQFEGKQYEFHGYDSANNTWGLFGWVGASSTTFTSSPAIYGVSTSTTISDYGNVSDEALKSDWGKAIGDGNTWRTLSMDEWGYLFGMEFEDEYYVPKAGHPRADKLGLATVNNVTGLVLLPDSWNLPSGCEFTPTALDGDNKVTDEKNFSLNIYTVEQWSRMESAGAVFLPVAGGRTGSDIGSADRGYYWSSSVNNDSNAYNVSFHSEGVLPDDDDSRHLGLCVRLITDVPSAPTPTMLK